MYRDCGFQSVNNTLLIDWFDSTDSKVLLDLRMHSKLARLSNIDAFSPFINVRTNATADSAEKATTPTYT